MKRIKNGLVVLTLSFLGMWAGNSLIESERILTDQLTTKIISTDTVFSFADTILVDMFTMTFNSAYNHSTPILMSNKEYYMRAEGNYRFAAINNGLDVAYYYCYFSCSNGCDFNNPCDSTLKNYQILKNLRPYVDTFKSNHAYNYQFIGADTAMVFEFVDGGGYGDNAGSIDIEIYEITDLNKSVVVLDSTSLLFNTSETGLIMKSENGSFWNVNVSNSGQLIVQQQN